jgi:hypothetical protein
VKLLQCRKRIGEGREPRRTRFDVVPDERPVLVQRACAAVVLLEDERDVGAAVDVTCEQREARKREQAERTVQMRRAYGHTYRYALGSSFPAHWHVGHQ